MILKRDAREHANSVAISRSSSLTFDIYSDFNLSNDKNYFYIACPFTFDWTSSSFSTSHTASRACIAFQIISPHFKSTKLLRVQHLSTAASAASAKASRCAHNRDSPVSGLGCICPHSGPPTAPKITASQCFDFSTEGVVESEFRSRMGLEDGENFQASCITSGPAWSPGRTRILNVWGGGHVWGRRADQAEGRKMDIEYSMIGIWNFI